MSRKSFIKTQLIANNKDKIVDNYQFDLKLLSKNLKFLFKFLRKSKNITIKKFCKSHNVSIYTMSGYLSGSSTIKLDILSLLSKETGYSIDSIVFSNLTGFDKLISNKDISDFMKKLSNLKKQELLEVFIFVYSYLIAKDSDCLHEVWKHIFLSHPELKDYLTPLLEHYKLKSDLGFPDPKDI